jgi:hypothetical protein
MVAPTCSGITLQFTGSVPSAFWEMLNWGAVDRILWMGVLCLVTCCPHHVTLTVSYKIWLFMPDRIPCGLQYCGWNLLGAWYAYQLWQRGVRNQKRAPVSKNFCPMCTQTTFRCPNPRNICSDVPDCYRTPAVQTTSRYRRFFHHAATQEVKSQSKGLNAKIKVETCNRDAGFCWFSWVLEQKLGWFPFYLSQFPLHASPLALRELIYNNQPSHFVHM